jgi:hypothetical protein
LTPRELAKELLLPYVTRGDSREQITAGHMGGGCRDYNWQIGGTVWHDEQGRRKRKEIDRYQLAFTEWGGQACLISFSVDELIAEIKAGIEQPLLWEVKPMTVEDAKAAYLEACQRAKLVYDRARLAAEAKRDQAYAALGSRFPGVVPPGKGLECWKIEQAYDRAMGKAGTTCLASTKPYHEALLAAHYARLPEPTYEKDLQLLLWKEHQ